MKCKGLVGPLHAGLDLTLFLINNKVKLPCGEAKENAVMLQPAHHRAQLSPSARMAVPWAKRVRERAENAGQREDEEKNHISSL